MWQEQFEFGKLSEEEANVDRANTTTINAKLTMIMVFEKKKIINRDMCAAMLQNVVLFSGLL